MPRRTSRPRLLADDAPLPDGYTRHDGGHCPVSLTDRPGLLLRSGSRIRAGVHDAEHWDLFAGGSLWRWQGNRPSPMDIVAWRAEDGQEDA